MSGRIATATRLGIRDQVRRPLLIALLVAIPIVFILWGANMTAETPRTITLVPGQKVYTDLQTLMTVIDIPVAIAFLSGLVGVFVVNSALAADRRLVIAGFKPGQAVVPRLIVLAAAVVVIAVVSIVVGLLVYTPERWLPYVAGNLFVGIEYAAIGALAGALLGQLGAVYLIFFLPNVDIGIVQDPLFWKGEPQSWAPVFPGYGPTRMIMEASYSSTTDMWVPLLASLGWTLVLVLALTVLLRRTVTPHRVHLRH